MREKLRGALQEAAGSAVEFELRRHRTDEFTARGEYSSNLAFVLAAKIKSTPQMVAERLQSDFLLPGVDCITSKGFLNFRMNDETLHESLTRAVNEGENYGASEALKGQRINVEFVSADPTGPLQLAHGRIAVTGDALCRLLALAGADVTREYFLNDTESSSKLRLLGESVAAHYNRVFGREEEMPEGALDDAFVREVAAQIAARDGNSFLLRPDAERISVFAHEAREAAVESQKQTLRALGVAFDVWTSESALSGDGRVAAIVARLQKAGHLSEKEGALWLKTSAFGDEADRALQRANGQYTYLASDIAYHAYRFERGFDQLVNIWTVEHEQYLARTHAALLAADYPAQNLNVLVCENTQLTRDGAAQDGEREFLLNDALEEVDAQALRFLWLLPEWNEFAAIELDVAQRDDESNPSYAARLLPSRLKTLERQENAAGQAETGAVQWNEAERQLARLVALWPGEAAQAAHERRPQRVARFVVELSGVVRQLLVQARPDRNPSAELLRAGHVVAVNALRVLGIEAREQF